MKKILILAANPKTTPRLSLDEEVRGIEEGLRRSQYRDKFELVPKWAVRPRDIQRAMLEQNPQIVHFSGHGDGEAGLVFENEQGNVHHISGAALAELFDLFSDRVECVLLNGCYSRVQAEAIVQHIDYVIGMSQAVPDPAAIEFAVSFYDALGAGRSYEFAYRLACNAIRLNTPPINSVSTRKLVPVDEAGESMGGHLIPVLLKRSGISERQEQVTSDAEVGADLDVQAKKRTFETNLSAIESAGQARLESLNERIAEEESKFQKTVAVHIGQALEWLKRNEKSVSQGARDYALSNHKDVFKNLSLEEQDDFQWEIEKYVESVYFSMLTNSPELLDDPITKPSLRCSEAYQTAFDYIKNRIPTRLDQGAREQLFRCFDDLFERLFLD